MQIALFGTDSNVLKKHKETLKEKFKGMDSEVIVSCYDDEELLKNNLKNYQVILMEEPIMEKFETYAEYRTDKRKITFTTGRGLETYYIRDIYYVEAELSKIHLITKEREHILPITITEAENILEAYGFIKPHRSYLINVVHINRIRGRMMVLDNGKEIPISKYRLKQIREEFLKMTEV